MAITDVNNKLHISHDRILLNPPVEFQQVGYDNTTLPEVPSGWISGFSNPTGASYDMFGGSVFASRYIMAIGSMPTVSGYYKVSLFNRLTGTHISNITNIIGSGSYAPIVPFGRGSRFCIGIPDRISNTGGVYVYNGSSQGSLIVPFDAATQDKFGTSLSSGCNIVAAGAPGKNSNTGAVYLILPGSSARIFNKIVAHDGVSGDKFGTAVSVQSNRVAVGAPEATTVSGTNSGAVYLYDLHGMFISKLLPPDVGNAQYFGQAVSVASGRVVVAAPQLGAGSVYIYDTAGNYIKKLSPATGMNGDNYGFSVTIGNGRIFVGSPYENSYSGAVYVYDLDGNYLTKLVNPDGLSGTAFGFSCAIYSTTLLIGAVAASSHAGRAYLYTIPETAKELMDVPGYW